MCIWYFELELFDSADYNPLRYFGNRWRNMKGAVFVPIKSILKKTFGSNKSYITLSYQYYREFSSKSHHMKFVALNSKRAKYYYVVFQRSSSIQKYSE